jgi:Lon protease-like protein
MTPKDRVEAAAPALKVFPLPSLVMFPHSAVPLHIFEPRYREMLRDSLSSDRIIALAQPTEGWEEDYYGRPSLHPIACASMVVWHQGLTDGRSNIILQGVCRVRLLEELPPRRSYREVRSEVIHDPPFEGREEALLRQALLELGGHLPSEIASQLLQTAARTSGGALADIVASSVVTDLERRQELLTELDPRVRLHQVLREVGEAIARVGAKPQGPVN